VYEVGVRKAILKNTKIYLEKIGELSDQPHQVGVKGLGLFYENNPVVSS